MKKLINIAAVLLAASMIFVGCSNGVAAPGSNNGGSGSGNGGSGSNSTETETEEKEQIDLTKSTWGWGYDSSWENDDDGSLLITLTKDNGAGSFGYNPVKDWSNYKAFVVVLGDKTNWNGSAYGQVTYKDSVGGDEKANKKGFDVSKNAQTLRIDFTDSDGIDYTKIQQISVQSQLPDTVIHVVDCYLVKK